MTDLSKILDKILPEKLPEYLPSGENLGLNAIHNAFREETRQRLLDTYGKEWVGVPSMDKIAEIIMDINFESYGFSHEEVAIKTAESILKGLRGK